MPQVGCIQIIATIFISPLGHFCVKGRIDAEWCINLLLFILGVVIIGSIHAFTTYGINCCTSILCWVLPPLGILFSERGTCTDVIICLLLCILGWFPGVIYAYYAVLNGPEPLKQKFVN